MGGRHPRGRASGIAVTHYIGRADKPDVGSRLGLLIITRLATAVVRVLLVASATFLLSRAAPGDPLPIGLPQALVDAERHRLGLDQPLIAQYARWLRGVARLDWGESTAHPGRPVATLVAERAPQSARIGVLALVVATGIGVPLGIFTGSHRRGLAPGAVRAASLVLLCLPPIALSLGLLFLAARTGWFPMGGPPAGASAAATVPYLVLPVVALALPIAAVLERLQSRALHDVLGHPIIIAARARGLSTRRVIWRHALRLSLRPVIAIYGVMIGALISGSFVVEYVMTWPGLGRLMYEALVGRDANLVAACAAAGAAFLSFGVAVSDVLLVMADPRTDAPS